VSSATVDAKELQEFFNLREKKSSKSSRNKDTSVILTVAGRTHPIEVCYSQGMRIKICIDGISLLKYQIMIDCLCHIEPVPNYVKDAVNTVVKIHEREEKGDILVFLTGQEEVDTACNLLRQHSSSVKSKAGCKMDTFNDVSFKNY